MFHSPIRLGFFFNRGTAGFEPQKQGPEKRVIGLPDEFLQSPPCLIQASPARTATCVVAGASRYMSIDVNRTGDLAVACSWIVSRQSPLSDTVDLTVSIVRSHPTGMQSLRQIWRRVPRISKPTGARLSQRESFWIKEEEEEGLTAHRRLFQRSDAISFDKLGFEQPSRDDCQRHCAAVS